MEQFEFLAFMVVEFESGTYYVTYYRTQHDILSKKSSPSRPSVKHDHFNTVQLYYIATCPHHLGGLQTDVLKDMRDLGYNELTKFMA